MAPGVKSSGSTLIPPVQNMMSAPAAFYFVDSSHNIVRVIRHDFMGDFFHPKCCAHRSSMIGVKASLMRPSNTSDPVVTMPIVLRTNGLIVKIGPPIF